MAEDKPKIMLVDSSAATLNAAAPAFEAKGFEVVKVRICWGDSEEADPTITPMTDTKILEFVRRSPDLQAVVTGYAPTSEDASKFPYGEDLVDLLPGAGLKGPLMVYLPQCDENFRIGLEQKFVHLAQMREEHEKTGKDPEQIREKALGAAHVAFENACLGIEETRLDLEDRGARVFAKGEWETIADALADKLAKKRILYAEDDPSLRRVVTSILKRLGYEVVAVDSAKAGIEEARHGNFDLVITDREMEEPWAGFDLTEAVHTLHPDTPIIMMSGYDPQDHAKFEEDLKERGGTALVNKEDCTGPAWEVLMQKYLGAGTEVARGPSANR